MNGDPISSHSKNNKKSKPKRYQFKSENPNRVKNSMSTEVKVGVI